MRLACALVEHGIEPGDRVVIALAKEVALPIAIFGTLLAGGAYVPIDYLTPPARAHAIAADSKAVAVISGLRTMRAMVLGDAYPAQNGPRRQLCCAALARPGLVRSGEVPGTPAGERELAADPAARPVALAG